MAWISLGGDDSNYRTVDADTGKVLTDKSEQNGKSEKAQQCGAVKFLRICDNCFDYDREKKHCLVRYAIFKDKTRTPMKRKAMQKGCSVFLFKA